MKFVVRNLTRDTTLGDAIDLADTSTTRNVGLLKHTHLEPGHGLWIKPCEGIHMFFMKFAIDLVYIDKQLRVKKVVRGIRPWRISLCLSAHSVMELREGTIDESQTQPGDQLSTDAVG